MTIKHGSSDGVGNGHVGSSTTSTSGPAVDAALSALTNEFRSLVADVEDLVQATGSLTGEELARAKQKLQARISAARDYVGDAATSIADRARNTAKSANNYVHEQPWQVIGITAAAGLLIGFLLGRRR
jgi:ElaB/YqjD/DUF883 family membrane-anchored ribosome-binding protein